MLLSAQVYPIGVISLEMPSSIICTDNIHYIQHKSNEILGNAKCGSNDEEYNRLIYSLSGMENIPLFIDDSSSVSAFENKTNIIRKMVNKLGLQMVMIDQFNHIHHNESNRSRKMMK